MPSKGLAIVLCDCAARQEAAHARWKAETKAKAHATRTTALIQKYDAVANDDKATPEGWDRVAKMAQSVNDAGNSEQAKAIEAYALMQVMLAW